jgi:hypothetical protein
MELLRKSGQLSNEVIFKAPCQIGGEKSNATDPGKPEGSHFIEKKNRDLIPSADRGKASHATDPGKPEGSHFIETKNRDSIPSADRGKASHATDPGKPEGSHFIKMKNHDSMPSADRARKGGKSALGKPKGGSTEWYVTEEVNPVDKTPLSEKGSRSANTKKNDAAQLDFEGAVPSFKSALITNSWTKEANDTESKTTFMKERLWKLIIVAEESEDITAVDDEMYKLSPVLASVDTWTIDKNNII